MKERAAPDAGNSPPVTHDAEADNARHQPSDDPSDRAAPTDSSSDPADDAAQRADRASREVDAPRRGAPPGAG